MSAGLGTWLVSLASPMARRVLSSLGLGVVTFVGVDLAVGNIVGLAKSSWGGADAVLLGLLNLAGVGTSMSIIAGAVSSRLALMAMKRMMLL
jgi:hypothetical protein